MLRKNSIAIIALLTLVGSALAADTFKLDPVHSFVTFKIKHLNTSYSFGRFNQPTGTFAWDDANPAAASFDLSIDVNKIDTGVAQRDTHLKSPDFFDAKQFPAITFKSTAVKKNDDGSFDVTGDLSLHGTTKSITLSLEKTGAGAGPGGKEIAGVLTKPFTIKRSDFGMTGMQGAVGDEVTLVVGLEGQKQ